ncbi:two component transcriptional regulator, winged helix family [Chondromyces apiculatus DSM 436]|uniref:Two component transcriptional regulator, winged helix family n=1 Tax=Chondromyces apiculatus DSM 436 TaxID=1192034 RepID=A0A017T6K7_9BACT|nr:two component transcriptional regulator, winged helix family [Chondromyces apiculatus DSM 436]
MIEDDEWVARLLNTAIREAGYEVAVRDTAESGLAAACTLEPEAIVCDIDLPDHDGYWVARGVRMHPSRVSVTPFLFLSSLDDQESRLQGFHVGADVYMTKPFRVGEVVAQIGALVQMASRLRHRRESLLSIPPAAEQMAIEGDLGQLSVATVLTVLEMERRTGIFEVTSKKRRARIELAEGAIARGTVGAVEVTPLAALRSILSWKVGRFSFLPVDVAPPSERRSVAAYLLEATRLEDESGRPELDLPPSRRRPELKLATTALGGPPPSPEDYSPPSSRALRPNPAVVISGENPPSFELMLDLDSVPPSGPASSGRRGGPPPSLRTLARSAGVQVPSQRYASPIPSRPAPLAPPRPAPRQPPRPEGTSKKR